MMHPVSFLTVNLHFVGEWWGSVVIVWLVGLDL